MTLRVVCLDAADTLFTERTSRARMYAETFDAFGVPLEVELLARWMGEVHDELADDTRDGPRYSDAWFRTFVARLLARAGADLDPEPLRQQLADRFTRAENYVVFGDTFPTLDELLQRGLRLAVVSNWSDRLPGLLHDLRLAPYFEAVAVSAVVGACKPSPALFRHALEQLGVPPDEAVHVGNHPIHDVAGARQLGLAALLLDRAARPPAPAGVIHSLSELTTYVDGT